MNTSTSNGWMEIITFQTREIVDALVSGEQLNAQPRFVPDDWQPAYGWMRRQMTKRCQAPSREEDLLLWGWPIAHEPERDYGLGDETRPLCRVTLALRRTDILLSDFQAWHSVLAGHRINAGEAEETTISAEESWTRIFDADTLSDDYWGKRDQRIYQACFWQPDPKAIQAIEPVLRSRAP